MEITLTLNWPDEAQKAQGAKPTVTAIPGIPPKFIPGDMIWKVNGAIVNEIHLVVGKTRRDFKLAVLEENGDGNLLEWTTGGAGANIPPPPPPPDVRQVFIS